MASWTDKQRRFVDEYVVDCNAAAAARRAGYSERTAKQRGYALMQDPDIQEAIEERLEELAMSAAEATMRMGRWGRGSIAPFVSIDEEGDTFLDLSSEEAQRHLHLIRDLKQTETVLSDDAGEMILKRTIQVKLHDAKDATRLILKMHGKLGAQGTKEDPFHVKHDINFSDLTDEQVDRLAAGEPPGEVLS